LDELERSGDCLELLLHKLVDEIRGSDAAERSLRSELHSVRNNVSRKAEQMSSILKKLFI
jgi:hypothetical protein